MAKYGNHDRFDEYDANGDGVVDADEFLAGQEAVKQYNAIDKDRDGIDRKSVV